MTGVLVLKGSAKTIRVGISETEWGPMKARQIVDSRRMD